MGRELPLPEQADSWGEFHARLERELDDQDYGHRLTPLWWSLGGVLFALTLVSCTYAVQDHHWWLWLCMLAALAADIAMAARAVDRADHDRARRAELMRLQEAWQDHLDSSSATRQPPG